MLGRLSPARETRHSGCTIER